MLSSDVFHYTRREIALEKILPERMIRLGQIGFTNDPRESKERFYSFMYSNPSVGFMLPIEQMMDVLSEVNTLVSKEWKVFCVSQHHPDYDNLAGGVMSSFFRGDCRPRMWATYAENHKGVCLKFNKDKLDQRLRDVFGDKGKVFCGTVVYDDLKVFLPLEPMDLQDLQRANITKVARDFCIQHWEELFLVKSKDWETEFEYRWLVHSAIDAPLYLPIDGVIESVLVGQDFPKVYFPSLIELCKGLKIPAGRIGWRNGVPNYQYEEIYNP